MGRMVPLRRILSDGDPRGIGGIVDVVGDAGVGGSGYVANDEAVVGRVFHGTASEVHAIPKLAIERYMYFAGLVKDNVGVTYDQPLFVRLVKGDVREGKPLGEKPSSQVIYPHSPFASGILWIHGNLRRLD